jgi:hypothetical protein
MICSRLVASAVVALSGVISSAPVGAQPTVLVGNGVYESADLVAPNAVLVLSPRQVNPAGGSPPAWTIGLRGSELTVEGLKPSSPAFAWFVGGSVTPFSANGSTRIYRDGKREPELSFTDRSVAAEAGIRFQPARAWRTDLRLIGLREFVAGVDDDAWHHPYAGIGVAHTYRRFSSEDVLQSRFEGISFGVDAVRFFGTSPWWRGRVTVAGGTQAGPVFLRGHAAGFDGGGLNQVSRFLVGGCWDGADGLPLYGFHYAQFRLDRGVVFNGGVDLRLRGSWEIGLRGGELRSTGVRAHGTAVTLGASWNGIAWRAGIGFPGHVSGEPRGAPFVFAGITAAVIQ